MARRRRSMTRYVCGWHVSKASYEHLERGEMFVMLVPNHAYSLSLGRGIPMRVMHGTRRMLRTVVAVRHYATITDAPASEDISGVRHGDTTQTLGYLDGVYRREKLYVDVLAIEFEPL